jgi:hypothetical protein
MTAYLPSSPLDEMLTSLASPLTKPEDRKLMLRAVLRGLEVDAQCLRERLLALDILRGDSKSLSSCLDTVLDTLRMTRRQIEEARL